MSTNKGDFLIGLLIGGALGAAIALLYAPQSGDETRQQMKRKSGEWKDQASETYEKARERAGDISSEVKDRTTQVATSVRENAAQMAARVGDRMRRTPGNESEGAA